MLILPERNAPRGKLLLPQRRLEWDQPSQRRYIYGIPDQTRFRITARLHDGAIYWCGWFDDREDADAFFFAAFAGSLHYERELWRLPKPCWHPEFADLDLVYDLATVTFLTSPTGSNQTWTSPSDWNNGNNSIEGIGAGGGGRSANNTSNTHVTGGGGGQYAKITNFVVATPGTTTATYQIGAPGSPGGTSWFNSTVDPGAGADNTKLGAKGGSGGNNGAGNQAGGPGGTGGWGTTLNAGGRGGNLSGASGNGASGGGGAAGPNGAGNNGTDSALTSTVGTAGGAGDAGSGGASGAGNAAGNGTAGGNGTEWDASHGSGGAGGGAVASSGNTSGGAGGLYGAGASSCIVSGLSGTPSPGNNQQGILVITYTPGSGLNKTPLRYFPRRR